MTETDKIAAPMIAWIVEQGLHGVSREGILKGYCERLVQAGLPLLRFHVAQRAFHPKFGGIGFSWTRAEGLSHQYFQRQETPVDAWLLSPFYRMLQQDNKEFRSSFGAEDMADFPLIRDLAGTGATDYFATRLMFGEAGDEPQDPNNPAEGMMVSWTSDQVGGFTEADLSLFRTLLPHLGLALKSSSHRQMASDLLQVYLGRDAGRRVLSGEIQRGSSQKIDAVICYFDLKGFTRLAEQLPGPDLIEMLNDYFGLAVATIQGHGGNILKFMGDGILTMFDLGSIQEDATAALAAASELRIKIAERNIERSTSGLPIADFTLALHAGEILYGNIGAENRLDFTVIGPTVNLTSRISGLHREVGQSIIVSEVVQRAAQPSPHDLVSLGRYMLRGVSEPVELYTIFEGAE
ncbi:guanylate cyclase [Rhodobacterales bacterium 56_14_T64]|nr:guanylate cyclase [Rhodobacterales bacterium 56_14_T64]